MNAKFEKWCKDNLPHLDLTRADTGYPSRETQAAWLGYKAAIQSLEVTDEMVKAACVEHYGEWDDSFTTIEVAHLQYTMRVTLNKVLSALKEQAK